MGLRVILPLVVALAAVSCDPATGPELPDRDATIQGPIVARDLDTSFRDPGQPTLHVKEGDDDPCGIIFTVEESTVVVRRNAIGERIDARVRDLTVGTRVRVWSDGAVADSCPAQARAEAVEIL